MWKNVVRYRWVVLGNQDAKEEMEDEAAKLWRVKDEKNEKPKRNTGKMLG